MRLPIRRFTVTGKSMEPFFREGDSVLTASFLPLRVGDVVVFTKNALTQIKRISKIHDGRYFVRGDNLNESTDSLDFGAVSKSEIVGKVVMHY